MSDQLERQVSRVLTLGHLLERALHDPGPWEITINDGPPMPVTIELHDRSVTFQATLDVDDPIYAEVGEGFHAEILCDGHVVGSKQMGTEYPILLRSGDTLEVSWSLAIPVPI